MLTHFLKSVVLSSLFGDSLGHPFIPQKFQHFLESLASDLNQAAGATVSTVTFTGNITYNGSTNLPPAANLVCIAGGAHRDLTFGTNCPVGRYLIANNSAGAHNIVCKNGAGDTILTVAQNGRGIITVGRDGEGSLIVLGILGA